jgi:hypothetical protein
MTLSVIVEIVWRETSAPWTSARWALISPVVNPLADSDPTGVRPDATIRNAACTWAGRNDASRTRPSSGIRELRTRSR